MKPRTIQDLLAERRANINEMRREHDTTARVMLRANIDQLTAEIERRREEAARV